LGIDLLGALNKPADFSAGVAEAQHGVAGKGRVDFRSIFLAKPRRAKT